MTKWKTKDGEEYKKQKHWLQFYIENAKYVGVMSFKYNFFLNSGLHYMLTYKLIDVIQISVIFLYKIILSQWYILWFWTLIYHEK